jgi:hypothetical protein
VNQFIAQECHRRAVELSDIDSKRLYERTGGVPLAIEWSIAQVAFGYEIESVLERLGNPFNDVSAYCFQGSLELIKDKPAYTLLMSLALFDYDASREELGFIADLSEDNRDDGLVDLEKLSLVNRSSNRFSMLPLTLSFCRAELSEVGELEEKLRERQELYLRTFLLRDGTSQIRTQDVVSSFHTISQLENEESLTRGDANELRLAGLHKVQTMTLSDPVEAENIILDYLLPSCIVPPSFDQTDNSLFRRRCRDLLSDWLDQYDEQSRHSLRARILKELGTSLANGDIRAVCWAISRIGFFDQELRSILWSCVDNSNDEQGDAALATLIDIGAAGIDHARLVAVLASRVQQRSNFSLLHVARGLSEPSLLEIVKIHWLSPQDKEAWQRFSSPALRILPDTAVGYFANNQLQDQIWSFISSLYENNPDLLYGDVLLGNDIGPRINSPGVVKSFLRWIGSDLLADGDGEAHRRWLAYLRLEKCVSPRQLLGWRDNDTKLTEKKLKEDVVSDSELRGRSLNREAERKKRALDCLKRLGSQESLNWFEEALRAESDPFMQKVICEHYACYRIDTMPKIIIDWIVEPYDWSTTARSSFEYARRLAAIHVAKTQPSEEVFDALLNFGFTANGTVLLDSAIALTTVASALLDEGRDTIGELIGVAISTDEDHRRICCLWALEMLAAGGKLSWNAAQLLTPLLSDARSRTLVVSILGNVDDASLQKEHVDKIREWASSEDDLLAQRSLGFLAHQNLLADDKELIVRSLGLTYRNDCWYLASRRSLPKWIGFITGLLYLRNPEEFSPVISELIETQEWQLVRPIISLIDNSVASANQFVISDVLLDSLMHRINIRHHQNISEPDTLGVAAKLAPQRLITLLQSEGWAEWIPAAREALANALGQIDTSEQKTAKHTIDILVELSQDSHFSVRRAAFRSIASTDISFIVTLCSSLAKSDSVRLRELAAEALVEIPDEANFGTTFEELYSELRYDSEPTVRRYSENSNYERRRRHWAAVYTAKIMEVDGLTGDGILSAGCYGQALIQVGDDKTLKLLKKRQKSAEISPNIRHWLSQIVAQLEKEWRKITKKWPDPVVAYSGTIEEANGSMLLGKKSLEVRFSLWLRPAQRPSEFSSWGGAAWTSDSWEFINIGKHSVVSIELEDGRKAKIHPQQTLGNTLIFLGQKQYPE